MACECCKGTACCTQWGPAKDWNREADNGLGKKHHMRSFSGSLPLAVPLHLRISTALSCYSGAAKAFGFPLAYCQQRIEPHIGDTGPVRRGEARPHRFLDKLCAASAVRRSAAILAQHEVRSLSRHVRVTGACTMGRTLPLRHGNTPSKPAPCMLGALGAAAGAHSLVYPATAAQALYGAVGAT